jgi:hypothetical protein
MCRFMDVVFPSFLALAIIAFVLLIVTIAGKYETKRALERNAAMETWGTAHGLSILDHPDPNPSLFRSAIKGVDKEKLRPFQAIKFLENGFAHNFLEGQIAGRTVWVFDHRYVVSTGKSTHTHDHTFVAVGLRRYVPIFELRPHTFWDKISALFGYRDIAIGNPEFDKKYYISSSDESFIQHILDSQLQDKMRFRDKVSWHCLNGFALCVAYGQCEGGPLECMLADTMFLANKVDG